MTQLRSSTDTLFQGQLTLKQPKEGYRAAIDPIFLAAAIPVKAAQTVLDVGTGVGTAALCLAFRQPDCLITGVEIQQSLSQLATENKKLNAFAQNFQIQQGDITNPALPLPVLEFDHVISNPPYLDSASVVISENASKARANTMDALSLKKWITFCLSRLKPKGTLTLIYRTDCLPQLLSLCHRQVGEITLYPLWPKAGTAAKRIIIRGRKGIKSLTTLCTGMVLHEEDGQFTQSAQRILQKGAPLE